MNGNAHCGEPSQVGTVHEHEHDGPAQEKEDSSSVEAASSLVTDGKYHKSATPSEEVWSCTNTDAVSLYRHSEVPSALCFASWKYAGVAASPAELSCGGRP